MNALVRYPVSPRHNARSCQSSAPPKQPKNNHAACLAANAAKATLCVDPGIDSVCKPPYSGCASSAMMVKPAWGGVGMVREGDVARQGKIVQQSSNHGEERGRVRGCDSPQRNTNRSGLLARRQRSAGCGMARWGHWWSCLTCCCCRRCCCCCCCCCCWCDFCGHRCDRLCLVQVPP